MHSSELCRKYVRQRCNRKVNTLISLMIHYVILEKHYAGIALSCMATVCNFVHRLTS